MQIHSRTNDGEINYKDKTRKDFASAVKLILYKLESGEPYTVNKLTEVTGLNYRTVKKALEFLESIQADLEAKKLDIVHADKMTMVHMKERTGMTTLPDNIQQLIIKSAYYPTTSREEEILAYLLLHKAVDMDSGIRLTHSKLLNELVEAQQIEATKDDKYYLSFVGKTVAEGALKLYPELKSVVKGLIA
jgi:hypothetical protein